MRYTLSPEAAADLLDLLMESRSQWGTMVARRTRARLERRFESIAACRTPGHRRADIAPHLPLLFAIEPPFVIAFDAETRQIVRIVDGRRDLPKLFGPGENH